MTTDNTNDNRSAWVDKIEAKIEQADARLDLLRAKAKEASADARGRMEEEMNTLEDLKERMEEQSREVQNASGEAWEDIKTGVSSAMKSISDAFDRATDRYR